MKRFVVALLVSCAGLSTLQAGDHTAFDRFFVDRTLRIDLMHSGSKETESFSLDGTKDDGTWPGSKVNLIDTLNLGEYLLRVYDLATNVLIYSRGYSGIFGEWQTTNEASSGYYRTFSESVRSPFPRRAVQVSVARRDKRMVFRELFTIVVDPNDPSQVNKEKPGVKPRVFTLADNGEPAEKVDIVILGDGYTAAEMEKFRKDAKRYNDLLFSTQPFKSRKQDFNVRALEVESQESGIDVPDKNVWKNAALETRYSTFGLPRYVLTTENKTLRDIAATVPYDFICILVNDTRYGGGGIFNLYSTSYTGEPNKVQEWWMDYMYVHEFGHSFAGLGDEYYTSAVAYNDFYAPGVEPWEPNITALRDARNVKWKAFLSDSIRVPTPWEKARYDSLGQALLRYDRLAPDYYGNFEPIWKQQQEIVRNPASLGKVGAFEGAGYASKGLYRPSLDCRMFSLSIVGFDPVCSAAIDRMIDFYAK